MRQEFGCKLCRLNGTSIARTGNAFLVSEACQNAGGHTWIRTRTYRRNVHTSESLEYESADTASKILP